MLVSQFASLKHFELQFKNWICSQDFCPDDLILVCNSWIEKELNQKTKLCYLGPMVVLYRTIGGSYLLAKLDGTISHLQYAPFGCCFTIYACTHLYQLWT